MEQAAIIRELRQLQVGIASLLDRLDKLEHTPAPSKRDTPRSHHRSGIPDTVDDEVLKARGGRWTELTVLLAGEAQLLRKRVDLTKKRFAELNNLNYSSLCRWLPPTKPGRRREVCVGSATDLAIRGAIDREVARLQAFLTANSSANKLGKS